MSLKQEIWDEVSITTVPRYKTSGISGDEWRTSAKIEIKWKGHVLFEKIMLNVDIASRWLVMALIDDDLRFEMCEAKDRIMNAGYSSPCGQPGCSDESLFGPYTMKNEYLDDGSLVPPGLRSSEKVYFCGAHRRRGDCDREDSDGNLVYNRECS